MDQKRKENFEWLENLFRKYYPGIKILKKEVYHDYAYSFQVELGNRTEIIEFRRYLVDDKLTDKIVSIMHERLG